MIIVASIVSLFIVTLFAGQDDYIATINGVDNVKKKHDIEIHYVETKPAIIKYCKRFKQEHAVGGKVLTLGSYIFVAGLFTGAFGYISNNYIVVPIGFGVAACGCLGSCCAVYKMRQCVERTGKLRQESNTLETKLREYKIAMQDA